MTENFLKHGFLEDEEPESGEIIEDEKESTEYYNKSTSFFDNISCEATDPHGERITRSAERKAQFFLYWWTDMGKLNTLFLTTSFFD